MSTPSWPDPPVVVEDCFELVSLFDFLHDLINLAVGPEERSALEDLCFAVRCLEKGWDPPPLEAFPGSENIDEVAYERVFDDPDGHIRILEVMALVGSLVKFGVGREERYAANGLRGLLLDVRDGAPIVWDRLDWLHIT